MSTSNHVVRIPVLLALLVSLSAAMARAQIWQGPASLEIKAEGKGASVAGANVELLYLALDPPAGPPPVQLDSRGRAVVNGLAEGMWRVSVSREGFMTYQAEVDVRRDDKPKLAATFQQNVPGAVHMMQVKIARAKPSGPTPLPPPPQIAERPAPRPAEPAPAAPASVAPAPIPAPAPAAPVQAAPVQEAPVQEAAPQLPAEPQPKPAAPTPAPRPAPPVPQPAPPVVDPIPPVNPDPSAEPAPPQAAPPVPPTRVPPPPASEPPQAQPQPVPPAPAPPAGGSVLHRSYADRTCYECKPGESSLSAERVVSRGAGCGAAVRDLLAQGGDPSGLPDGCAVLRLTLPPGARYTGYRYEIQERSGSVDCQAGRDCPGGGRWPVDPALARSADGTTVSAAFENPGAGNDRRVVLTIYYTER